MSITIKRMQKDKISKQQKQNILNANIKLDRKRQSN